MTIIFSVGRRVPKSWFRRTASTIGGLLSFQENIWIMINQSLTLAKKKANRDGRMKFVIEKTKEAEDMNYDIQWVKVIIQGSKEMEEEEYNECNQIYQKLGKIFKKDLPKDNRLAKHFNSKLVNSIKIEEAYKKGYGAAEDNNLASKLLEMGILTLIEKIDDFDSREPEYITDIG